MGRPHGLKAHEAEINAAKRINTTLGLKKNTTNLAFFLAAGDLSRQGQGPTGLALNGWPYMVIHCLLDRRK